MEQFKVYNSKIRKESLQISFKINEFHKCIDVKETKNDYVILCLYVNDMLIVGNDDKMVRFTKNMLKSSFDMKDKGPKVFILGTKFSRTSNKIILSQSHYVDKILENFNKDNFAL